MMELCVNALPNILITNVIKHVEIRDLCYPERHLTEARAGRTTHSSVSLSVFNVLSSFFHKTTPAKSRNIQDRKLDIESTAKKRKKKGVDSERYN